QVARAIVLDLDKRSLLAWAADGSVQRYVVARIAAAIDAEREACAVVCDIEKLRIGPACTVVIEFTGPVDREAITRMIEHYQTRLDCWPPRAKPIVVRRCRCKFLDHSGYHATDCPEGSGDAQAYPAPRPSPAGGVGR